MITETMITFQNAMLIGATCLVAGMFCGAGAFAAALEIFDKEKEPSMDYEAIQAELDNEFGTPAEVIAARMV